MRYLIPVMEANHWARFSTVVFFVVFLLILFAVYRPSRKRYLEERAKMPFEDESER